MYHMVGHNAAQDLKLLVQPEGVSGFGLSNVRRLAAPEPTIQQLMRFRLLNRKFDQGVHPRRGWAG